MIAGGRDASPHLEQGTCKQSRVRFGSECNPTTKVHERTVEFQSSLATLNDASCVTTSRLAGFGPSDGSLGLQRLLMKHQYVTFWLLDGDGCWCMLHNVAQGGRRLQSQRILHYNLHYNRPAVPEPHTASLAAQQDAILKSRHSQRPKKGPFFLLAGFWGHFACGLRSQS
jgi:hypothetical protein